MLRALQRGGWYVSRQSGSHVILRHPDRPGRAIVPRHRGTLKVGTLARILEQAGVSAEQFRRWR
ncbi:MAG: type II toxin-antitoxin system HicA family toxin [Dehalococcoidia bacterium]